MNKPLIRILYGKKTSNRHNRSLYFWRVFLETPKSQSTVDELIKTLELKYKVV